MTTNPMTDREREALPEKYEEVFIWVEGARRIARLDHTGKHFQLATFLSGTKGQYLVRVENVEKWSRISALSTEAQGDPVYQIKFPGASVGVWRDASQEAYEVTTTKNRRILYTQPPSAIEGYAEELAKRLVREKLEEAAVLAEGAYEIYRQTKEAHERATPQRFNPVNFGFNMDVVNTSKSIAMYIRALMESP